MRKSSLVVIIAILSLTCFAQNESEKAKIAEIRKMYNNEMEWIDIMLGDEAVPDDCITAKVRHNIAGTGQSDETVEFYFSDDFDEEIGYYVSSLNFVRKTVVYTIAERKKYEEFLYDSDGLPAFYFASFQTYRTQNGEYEEVYVEIRAYYDKGKRIHTICMVGKDKSSLTEQPLDEDLEVHLQFAYDAFEKNKKALDGMVN